jgi:mono/diheme cytochrome c family protein
MSVIQSKFDQIVARPMNRGRGAGRFRRPAEMSWGKRARFAGEFLALVVGCALFVAYGDRVLSLMNALSPGRPAQVSGPGSHLTRGRKLYKESCTICHGANGQGLPHQGADLRLSKFVAGESDNALVNFLRKGREANDPKSVQGLVMPPRGGNPSLDDTALSDIVLFLRQMQSAAHAEEGASIAP